MKRAVLTILAVLALAACGSSPAVESEQPTPLVVYITPEPTVEVTPEPEDEITPEPVIESTEEPVEVAEEVDPMAVDFKEWATIGDWDVRITKVNWNAAKALQQANMFNEKPPKGTTAVMIWVEGRYNGDGREELDPSYAFRAMGPSMVEYDTFSGNTCGVMPDPELALDDKTLRKGGKVAGWGACWIVDNEDVDGLVAFFAPFLSDEITGFYLR